MDPGDLATVRRILDEPCPGPFDGTCRLVLIRRDDIDPAENITLGTYGFIKGAREFIAGVVPRGGSNVEHLGFVLEAAILRLTLAGLGTCWLAGTFKREEYARLLDLAPDEAIPAVTPVGRPAGSPRIMERVFRAAVKADRRKPWGELFFEGGFDAPLAREVAGPFAGALDAVRAGPSATNAQPWRVVKEPGKHAYHFFSRRGFKLDRGIAACHFDLATREIGLRGAWSRGNAPAIDTGELEPVISWSGAGEP